MWFDRSRKILYHQSSHGPRPDADRQQKVTHGCSVAANVFVMSDAFHQPCLVHEDVEEFCTCRSKTGFPTEVRAYVKTADPLAAMLLRIIDTPGFGDTQGPLKDAENTARLARYCQANFSNGDCYPNLVLLVVNLANTRIEWNFKQVRVS